MSASTNKKLRKAAREAGLDKKQIAAQEEAAKKAKSKRSWTIGAVAVITLCAVIILLGSGILYKTTAVSIGNEKYNAAETNFFVGNQFQTYVKQYGDYASLFGLDPSMGVNGLSEQDCLLSASGGSWKDFLLEAAITDMTQIQALCAYAEENGISLTEEELSTLSSGIKQNETYAPLMGYNSVESFYTLNYGQGVNSKIFREQSERGTLANKALDTYSASIQYSAAELEEKYQSYEGEQDMFQFSYYYVAAETETVTNEDGTESTQVVEGGLEAAEAIANSILTAYEATSGEDYAERFQTALAERVEGASANEQFVSPSSMGTYRSWMMEEREAGDAAVIPNNTNGYYVIVFIERSDNHYNVAQVRHILVKAVADENGVYTESAKAAAKEQAEEYLSQWKSGEATEESFATMANLYSEDSGSNTNGGLYDGVIKGQMVEEFDEFCFGGHKKGDTAIVYGETSSYAGYHIMYYVGEGEQYSDLIAKNDLLNAELTAWIESLTAGLEVKQGFGARFVG